MHVSQPLPNHVSAMTLLLIRLSVSVFLYLCVFLCASICVCPSVYVCSSASVCAFLSLSAIDSTLCVCLSVSFSASVSQCISLMCLPLPLCLPLRPSLSAIDSTPLLYFSLCVSRVSRWHPLSAIDSTLCICLHLNVSLPLLSSILSPFPFSLLLIRFSVSASLSASLWLLVSLWILVHVSMCMKQIQYDEYLISMWLIARSFSTRASVATVLGTHPCVVICLRVKVWRAKQLPICWRYSQMTKDNVFWLICL